MQPEDRLKEARIKAGLSEEEVARHIGINKPWYYDLESHDDEIISTLDLAVLFHLCRLLQIRPHYLFDRTVARSGYTLENLQRDLKAKQLELKLHDEAYWNYLGWDVSGFFTDAFVFFDNPVLWVEDLARVVGKDWLQIIEQAFDDQKHPDL